MASIFAKSRRTELDDIAVVCTRLLNFRRIRRLWKVAKAVGMHRKDTGILFRRMSADEQRAVASLPPWYDASRLTR